MSRLPLGGLFVVLCLCAASGQAAQADVYRIRIDVVPAKSQFEGRMTFVSQSDQRTFERGALALDLILATIDAP